MNRAIPTGSKLCAKREEQRRQQLHKQRVGAVRSMVDTAAPRVVALDHVRNNLKREQMLEERYTEIDRENRILLDKMSQIMTAGSASTPRRPEVPRLPEQRMTTGPVSLNRDARKKELLKITKENQDILRRIQQAQPVYNHVEMEGSHRQKLRYLKNCAEYPLVLRTPRSARGPGRGSISSELVPMSQEDVMQGPKSARPHSHGAGVRQNNFLHGAAGHEQYYRRPGDNGDDYDGYSPDGLAYEAADVDVEALMPRSM